MGDSGFPGQHTTTTTVTTSNTNVQTNVRFDQSYIRTVPGYMKIAQTVLNLLVFFSVLVSDGNFSSLSFMSGICGFGFWFTGVLLMFYLFHIIEKFYKVPWLKIEFVFCAIWTLFLLIGSTVCVTKINYKVVFIFVSLFGYLAMCVYGYDCFLKFKAIQNGEIAQGHRDVSKTTSQVNSPAAY